MNRTKQEEELNEPEDDRAKCDQCDFKTRVRKYMKSHKMKHEGQYQYQRGCRENFKSLRLVDEHHKEKHRSPPIIEFKCRTCNSMFTS